MTTRLVKFLTDQARKDPAKYDLFSSEYSLFLREGIVSAQEQAEKVGAKVQLEFIFLDL